MGDYVGVAWAMPGAAGMTGGRGPDDGPPDGVLTWEPPGLGGYSLGVVVWHVGRLWLCTQPANISVPGVGSGWVGA